MPQEQEKKPVASLVFNFYKDGEVETKVDFDEGQI